ncbi:MAG TPA: Fic family protein [Stellaceae bacterium]|nr:Fic family protein [Stellaceae bacterium]
MLSFIPSLKLEKALKSVQAELNRLGAESAQMQEAEASWLHRWALISTIGASTRIENAVLTDAEIEWVDTTLSQDGHVTAFEAHKLAIFDKLSKDRERSVEEVVGCREVLGLIYLQAAELFPLTESAIRGLHHTLLSFYPAAAFHAGGYKISPNQVISLNHDTGERRVVLDPAPPGPRTDAAMRDLIGWYNQTIREHPWPLLVATEFVFRFLAIHPFQDGNGRLGRALFLLALMQGDDSDFGRVIRFISIDRQIERHRPLYYSVLQQVSGGRFQDDPRLYQVEPLVWFFLKMLEFALADVAILRHRYAALQRLSESAVKVLACFKSAPERRLKLADLMAETGLVRRTVQNALVALTEAGLVHRRGAGPGTRYQLIF